ncbi:EAL domain-containing response regulator [Uliginosibacterium sp. H3]|uniref:EAL domain-containing response regulator n=1 Tax=Uliginosibacterium silvisoli TaxID=3114758 RepID=A0ABU6K2W3_9RHOO|nr:EAL domain-containing response regulator [Uliginosibacterium sp. H3]
MADECVLSTSLINSGVLIVDDSAVQRQHAAEALARLGIVNIMQAPDGSAALDMLGHMSPAPAVLIVDLEMPVMDGVEMIHRLSKLAVCPAIIVASSRESVLIESVENMVNDLGIPLLGAVRKPISEDTMRQLLSRANSMLSPSPSNAAASPEICANELRRALDAGEIVPWFQPKAELGSGLIHSVEALARWVKPDGSVIPPMQFIHVAESSGLMFDLTLSILDQTIAALQRWKAQGHELSAAVNLSSSSLGDMRLADALLQKMEDAQLPTQLITLEITESIMVENAAALRDLIRLRLRGFGLSIDDYGTGFSSMQQLSRVPFSELKIDRSFVDGAHHRAHQRAILESAIDLGKRLGLATVAEGIETREDWHLLKSLGCQLAQGYLISKPAPADQIPDILARLQQKLQSL